MKSTESILWPAPSYIFGNCVRKYDCSLCFTLNFSLSYAFGDVKLNHHSTPRLVLIIIFFMLVILYTVSVKNYTDNGLNLNSYECYAVNQHVLSLESILLINHQVAGPRGRIYTPELVEQVGNVMIAADSSSPQEPQHASQAPPVSNTNKNHNQEVSFSLSNNFVSCITWFLPLFFVFWYLKCNDSFKNLIWFCIFIIEYLKLLFLVWISKHFFPQ